MSAERRNSPSSGRPSTSNCTVWVRFPWATAAIARVTSVVGRSKSSTRVLIDVSGQPNPRARQAHGKIYVAHSLQTFQNRNQVSGGDFGRRMTVIILAVTLDF